MYAEVLRSITGIAIFPVVSLVLFVAFFTGVLVWTIRLDDKRLSELSALPLEPERGEP